MPDLAVELRRRPRDHNDLDVKVFMALGSLIKQWKLDPEKLAVAAYAYENVLGYNAAAMEIYGCKYEEACELVHNALHRRNRKILRARAEGLVLALRETAEAAEAWKLHQVQVDVAVIECRQLPIEERLAKLRERETES